MRIPLSMLLLLVLSGGLCWASAEDSLYVGEAVVDPRPAEAREPMLDALNQVLVRLTGRVGADLVSELALGRDDAAAMALGRQFRQDRVPRRAGPPEERRLLQVDFDPSAVDALLADADLPRWGRERPEMLLWIVTDAGASAAYLEDDEVLQYALDRAAFRYGFDLTRPILDASDRLEVTPADVRGGFTGVTLPAVERYGVDGVILLDLRRNRSFWTGRWAWRIGSDENAFERSGADPVEVIELGLGRIAESLAARFAVRPTADDERRVVVSGIETPAHYREVHRFLGRLTGVDDVRLDRAAGETLTFTLSVSTDGLRQRIELTGPLEFVRHDLAAGTLYYRFGL